jgi:hypothetical protein
MNALFFGNKLIIKIMDVSLLSRQHFLLLIERGFGDGTLWNIFTIT